MFGPSRKNSSVEDVLALADEILREGMSASGLSGETDGGRPGPGGGGPPAEEDQQLPPISEEDVLGYSGSGPTTFVGPGDLPWDRSGPKRRPKTRVRESEGFLDGHPVDSTLTGRIQILVLDSVNLKIHAPSRILEQVEAYKFFEQFQQLLPRTPLLNINLMESIASWWRNFAMEGDLLEIDCTSGFATVTNELTNNIYALGCLGTVPTYPGIAG